MPPTPELLIERVLYRFYRYMKKRIGEFDEVITIKATIDDIFDNDDDLISEFNLLTRKKAFRNHFSSILHIDFQRAHRTVEVIFSRMTDLEPRKSNEGRNAIINLYKDVVFYSQPATVSASSSSSSSVSVLSSSFIPPPTQEPVPPPSPSPPSPIPMDELDDRNPSGTTRAKKKYDMLGLSQKNKKLKLFHEKVNNLMDDMLPIDDTSGRRALLLHSLENFPLSVDASIDDGADSDDEQYIKMKRKCTYTRDQVELILDHFEGYTDRLLIQDRINALIKRIPFYNHVSVKKNIILAEIKLGRDSI